MPAANGDPRLIVGRLVYAKAVHVTSLAECSRRFGSAASTRIVPGIVRDVERRETKTGRTATYVKAEFTVGDDFFRTVTLNIRSVVAGVDVPPRPAADDDIVAGEEGRPPAPPLIQIEPEAVGTSPTVAGPSTPAATAQQHTTTATATTTTTTDTTTTTPRTEARAPIPTCAATCHGRDWHDNMAACLAGVGEAPVFRRWFIRDMHGGKIEPGSVQSGHLSRLDFFLLMMPPRQLELMTREMNVQLTRIGAKRTTTGELLKFFGLLILTTKHQFSSRASLWSTVQPNKYTSAPNFGRKLWKDGDVEEPVRSDVEVHPVWSATIGETRGDVVGVVPLDVGGRFRQQL